MPDLPPGCDFSIVPNPCSRAEDRNWDAVIRALKNLCTTVTGDDDPDDPDPPGGLFGNLLIRFRLLATLTKGGSASAVMLDWNGSSWVDGAAITVDDDEESGGRWNGIAGYTGWARRAEDESTHFSVVTMQQVALIVRGTTGSLASGSATMSVASYSGGASPGISVTVHDVHGRWPDSVNGTLATALYNFEAGRYEVVQAEQSEWIAEAIATQNYGPTTSVVGITSVVFKTHQEYMPDPTTPTSARNTYGQTGSAGDIILIHKSKQSGEWEIVTGGNGGGTSSAVATPLHRFRLTGNIEHRGSSAAKRLTFNGAAYVETEDIVVFDRPYPATPQGPGLDRGMWTAMTGMEGWARKREVNELGGNDEYEIVWMEQFGRFILGTLIENMGETNPNEAEATVDYIFGQGHALNTEEFTVHDDQELFPFAREGAKFLAIRNEYLDTSNPQTPYYQLVVCQQAVIYGMAQLASDHMCPDDEEVEITQFEGWTPSLFNQQFPDEDKPGTAKNVFGLAAENGDKLFIVGDFSDPEDVQWKIVQTQHKAYSVITQIRFNPVNKCIEYKDVAAAIMTCEAESGWKTLICGRVCNNSS